MLVTKCEFCGEPMSSDGDMFEDVFYLCEFCYYYGQSFLEEYERLTLEIEKLMEHAKAICSEAKRNEQN